MVFCNLESRAAQSKKNVSKTIALPTVGMNVCKRLHIRRSRSTKLGADEKYAHIKVFST